MNTRQATVAGLYVTKQARRLPGRKSQELIIEAVDGALADAGLARHDVDGVALHWAGPGGAPMDFGANWAPYFKQPLAFTANDPFDQCGARALAKAAAVIEAGLCDVIVIGSGMAGPWSEDGTLVGASMGIEFSDDSNASTIAHFGLVANRYAHEYGIASDRFSAAIAHVAATIRNHGHVNPEAVMYGAGPFTVDDILASPMIASPFHRLDCCLVNEGACAIVLTTAERAADLRTAPVRVLGAGMEFARGNYTAPPKEMMLGQEAMARAFGRAGVGPSDIDVFSIYDSVSFEVIRQIECMGLCAPGEGCDFIQGDQLTLKGGVPTNLDGGLLSHSWIGTGQLTLKVIEAVRQLRGTCGHRQVPDAELAFVSNAGAAAHHIEVAVLGRA